MKFFKIVLAVVVGLVITGLLWMMMLFGLIGSFSGEKAPAQIKNESILEINISAEITDAAWIKGSGSNFMGLTMGAGNSVLESVRAVNRAATDDRIKGIYISSTMLGVAAAELTNLSELRAALVAFKESGKFIVSYTDHIMQNGFFLQSVADKLYMHPDGRFNWTGMGMTRQYNKNFQAMLGIGADVFRVGKYKSATEDIFRETMSAEDREQRMAYLMHNWGVMTSAISASRAVSTGDLNKYADELAIISPVVAVEKGLVDSLVRADQMHEILNTLAGKQTDLDKKANLITLNDYIASTKNEIKGDAKNKIAVIYLSGGIMPFGGFMTGNVDGKTIAKQIEKARKDKDVKAIVFRVNSPGGEALVSEQICREIELTKVDKPVIVSMGQYAASGGYLVSCLANKIVAEQTTITGSIGIYMVRYNAEKLFEEKLNFTTDGVKTNTSADMDNGKFGVKYRALTTKEKQYMQTMIEYSYGTFLARVAQGRGMTTEEVHEIAQGRVWTAPAALEIGLVDKIGGITCAIDLASEEAGIEKNYKIVEYKQSKTSTLALIMDLISVRDVSGEMNKAIQSAVRMSETALEPGVYALMPI